MRRIFYIILLLLTGISLINAQRIINVHRTAGYERYNTYQIVYYIDNLEKQLIPDLFNDVYCSLIKSSKLTTVQVIDTLTQTIEMHIQTKQAGSGYLWINQNVMDEIQKYDSENIKLIYVYNNNTPLNRKDVIRIVRLKKQNISFKILYDKESNMIRVFITNKRKFRNEDN